jgi:hypothetical protein
VFGRAKGQVTLKIQLDDWIRDERYELPMNPDTFGGLGLNCERPADNVAKVRTRIKAIMDADPAYVGYEQLRDPGDRRRVRAIVITRSRGALRQQLLRAAQERTGGPEELCA